MATVLYIVKRKSIASVSSFVCCTEIILGCHCLQSQGNTAHQYLQGIPVLGPVGIGIGTVAGYRCVDGKFEGIEGCELITVVSSRLERDSCQFPNELVTLLSLLVSSRYRYRYRLSWASGLFPTLLQASKAGIYLTLNYPLLNCIPLNHLPLSAPVQQQTRWGQDSPTNMEIFYWINIDTSKSTAGTGYSIVNLMFFTYRRKSFRRLLYQNTEEHRMGCDQGLCKQRSIDSAMALQHSGQDHHDGTLPRTRLSCHCFA